MATLERDGVTLHYVVEGEGPTLFLTHGFSGSTETFKDMAKALASSYRVVRWDIRGHGQSDAPEDQNLYTRDATIDDILALLDHVGAEKAHIGGHSLGGYLSIELYRRHPELFSSLILLNTGPGFKNDQARAGWNDRCVKDAERFEHKHEKQMALPEAERDSSPHRSYMGVARAARGILPQEGAEVALSLTDIKVPALILVGEHDTAFINAAEYMDAKIPHSTKIVIADAGHNAPVEKPEEMAKSISDFLAAL